MLGYRTRQRVPLNRALSALLRLPEPCLATLGRVPAFDPAWDQPKREKLRLRFVSGVMMVFFVAAAIAGAAVDSTALKLVLLLIAAGILAADFAYLGRQFVLAERRRRGES